MNELDLFLFHPVHISGSMTEMDEGAAEVSRRCNDVAAINGSSSSPEIIVEKIEKKNISEGSELVI